MAAEQAAITTKKETTKASLPSPQKTLATVVLLSLLILSIYIFLNQGLQLGIQLWIGFLLGTALFHARFGFTSAFRRLVSVGNGEGIRAHMVMLAVASTLFAIILANGYGLFGVKPAGYVSPVGLSLIVGSFLFGVGMQLGNGCASGTLYSLGGGQSSMFITLFGFIVGSVLGAWHFDFWINKMPAFPAVSLADVTGSYFSAWAVQMTVFAAIFAGTLAIERKVRPPKMKPLPTTTGWRRIIRGSWPLWTAAVVLAVLNAATLIVRGQPWGITSAFALWGSKAAMAVGIDVTEWAYWSGANSQALKRSVLADSTSVMNFGIILGAMLASCAGGFYALRKIPLRKAAAALIGGILMGYGARLAFGCNVGAYFGGIASFSFHGWVWAVIALLGSYTALFLRPLFGLSNPNRNDQFC